MSTHTRPPLTLEEVRHVAKLARLRLTDAQLDQYRTQLSAILDHIDKLSELDVSGVEPMAHPTEITNRLDEDEALPPMPIEHLLQNAPAVEDRFLAVPKVLAEESS
jgi:aspartyl-tRNA(Asn)/glutamyl-tRNA(Gln) amidotransferase subunit C